jgi:hypothetical protein
VASTERGLPMHERLPPAFVWRGTLAVVLFSFPTSPLSDLLPTVGGWHHFANKLSPVSLPQMLAAWAGIPTLPLSALILFLAPGCVLAARLGRAQRASE